MAEPSSPGVVYGTDITGEPVKGSPEMYKAGVHPISQVQAEEQAQAIANLNYAEEHYGPAGKLGLGAISGLTLGIAPGALANAGVINPWGLAGAQASPLYTAGDVAGMMAPALLSGGESLAAEGLALTPAGLMSSAGGLAERGARRLAGVVAAGMLPESAGLLGRAATVPIGMAARGATEGALVNMGHTIGDNLLQNKPLSAEALWASGEDGALGGGLIGAGLGTVGALGGLAVEGSQNLIKRTAGGSGAKGVGTAAKSLGGDFAGNLTEDLEANKGLLKSAHGVMETGGTSFGDTVQGKIRGVTKAEEIYTGTRNEAIDDLTKSAPDAAPSLDRITGRLESTVVAPRAVTPGAEEAGGVVNKFIRSLTKETKVAGIEEEGLHIPGERIPGEKVPGQKVGRIKLEQPEPPLSKKQYEHQESLKPLHERTSWDQYKADFYAKRPAVDIPGTDIPGYTKPDTFTPEINRPGTKLPGYTEQEPLTWKKLIQARDQLAEEVGKTRANPLLSDKLHVKAEILNALDDEIRVAAESAQSVPGLEGVAEKYGSATANLKLAKEIRASLGAKYTNELLSPSHGLGLNTHDFTSAAFSAAMGHPIGAVGIMAAKTLSRQLQKRAEPWLAQMAYNNAIGTKAAGATLAVKQKISDSLSKFFKEAAKTPYRGAQAVRAEKASSGMGGNDRANYEAMASRAEQLVSDSHQERVRMYAQKVAEQGYQELAQELMASNARAVQYAMYAMPARQGTKGLTSLRKTAVSKVLTMPEFKFTRQMRGLGLGKNGPLGDLLSDLENGSLSIDQVRAFKYTLPEVHGEVVAQATQQIYEMKASGAELPMDKIYALGAVLGEPIDRTLQPDYVNAVQMALATPSTPPDSQGGQPPQQNATMPLINVQNMQTPLQKAAA